MPNTDHLLGNAGSYSAPGELLMYPQGFQPLETLKEEDYQYNIGFKFNLAGWDVDANIGYGKEIDKVSTCEFRQPVPVHRYPHLSVQFL